MRGSRPFYLKLKVIFLTRKIYPLSLLAHMKLFARSGYIAKALQACRNRSAMTNPQNGLDFMIAHDANPAPVSRAETADLGKLVAGPVLLPDDAGYQTEYATFNLMSAVRPAVAVGATSVADVQVAV